HAHDVAPVPAAALSGGHCAGMLGAVPAGLAGGVAMTLPALFLTGGVGWWFFLLAFSRLVYSCCLAWKAWNDLLAAWHIWYSPRIPPTMAWAPARLVALMVERTAPWSVTGTAASGIGVRW